MSDHAADAITYSNLAYENRANPTYQGFADLAQLHATLALVEQQKRIADRLDDFYSGAALTVDVRS